MTNSKQIEAAIEAGGILYIFSTKQDCQAMERLYGQGNYIYVGVERFTDEELILLRQVEVEILTHWNDKGDQLADALQKDFARFGVSNVRKTPPMVETVSDMWGIVEASDKALQSAQTRTETVEGDELLPCPFYRNAGVKHTRSQYGHKISVFDADCKYETEIYNMGYFSTKEAAIKAWNTRTEHVEDVREVDVEGLKTILRDTFAVPIPKHTGHNDEELTNALKKEILLDNCCACLDWLHTQGHLSPTPLKPLDNSDVNDTNVAPRKTLEDAENHDWDRSKFVRMDMDTGEKVEPRLEHIEELEGALRSMDHFIGDLWPQNETVEAMVNIAHKALHPTEDKGE